MQATATAMVNKDAASLQLLAERYEMKFVAVPGGKFMLGSPAGIGADDEHPQHEVTLDNFWIGQTEVTNAQYRPFAEAGGYSQDQWWTATGLQGRNEHQVTAPNCWANETWNQPKYPVVCISWYEAVAYARWLANATNLPVRLPTEAERERAARGDDGRVYAWGDASPTDQLLNYSESNLQRTTTVGSYPAGNVWEWTSSHYIG